MITGSKEYASPLMVKTGLFLMYMLVLQSISTNLELCPAVNVPKDPSMIIAYHTQQLD